MMKMLMRLVAVMMLSSFTMTGCVWIEHKKDNGLHKGQYKAKKAKKAHAADEASKGHK